MSHLTNATSRRRRLTRGFTLIELMVTVAIVAILSSVAIPSYTDYLRRGKLPEAFSSLSDYRVKMEQYYQDNRNYGTAACADTGPPSWSVWPNTVKYFQFDCARTLGGQGYTITATSTVALGSAHTYTVNQANLQTTTAFKGSTYAGKNCWLTKSDTEC